jgi:hypothetical protein
MLNYVVESPSPVKVDLDTIVNKSSRLGLGTIVNHTWYFAVSTSIVKATLCLTNNLCSRV